MSNYLSAWPLNWHNTTPGNLDRARILGELRRSDGRHLVIVRYGPGHNPLAEWVYNGADLDRAKVIWAQDMSSSRNKELLSYFADRRVWLVEPDLTPPKLSPYRRFPDP